MVEKSGGIKEERYYLGNYEVYRKFVGITLETERTTVALTDEKRKIATIDKLTVEERSLITLPLAVIRYQFDNHLGSASLELDASAQIITYEEYHPFGTTSYRSGRSETEVSLKRYKYVGKERDEETGLYYYGFRYYAAWIARFINVDPLQHEYPHYTPFQYAGNKPITYVDLDGLEEAKKGEENNNGNGTWSLRVYSPIISAKLKKAICENNLIEARRLTFYALNHEFEKPNNVDPSDITLITEHLNPYKMAATLHYSPEGSGLNVYFYNWANDKRSKIGREPDFLKIEEASNSWVYDQYYPVDVNLYNFSDGRANGNDFYKTNDFIGIELGASYTFGLGGSKEMTGITNVLSDGSSLTMGYLRGYGFIQLSGKVEASAGWTGGLSAMKIQGSYSGSRDSLFDFEKYSPFSLAGGGMEVGGGLYFTTNKTWKSVASDGSISFSGTAKGFSFSFGLPAVSGEISIINSKIVFPSN